MLMKKQKITRVPFFLPILLLIFLAMAIGFTILSNKIASGSRNRALTGTTNELHVKAIAFEEKISESEELIEQYILCPDIKDLLLNPTDEYLRNRVQDYTETYFKRLVDWEGLYLATADTEVIVHTTEPFIGLIMRDEEGAKKLCAQMNELKGLLNTGAIASPVSGRQLISFYCPVYDKAEIIGYAGGGPLLSGLKPLLDKMTDDTAIPYETLLIETERNLYLYTDEDALLGQDISVSHHKDIVSYMNSNNDSITGNYSFNLDGVPYVACYSKTASYDWALIEIYKEADIFAFSNSTRNKFSSLIIVGVLIFLLIALFLASRIRKEREAKNTAVSESAKKTAYFANMSHEIRTPMNAVTGLADILLNSELTDEQRMYVSSIKYAGGSLVSIVNDILDYSKIESGNMSLIPVDYSTSKLLQNVSFIAKARMKSEEVAFIVDVDKDMPRMLHGDDIRLKQIHINLIGNSIKFTESGLIKFLVRVKSVENGKADIDFIIRDTGVGIKKEDMEKLFTSFTQVDTTRNREKEGTGLGLAITKMLTELMGGKLSVESEYGKGTTFILSLTQDVVDASPMEPLDQYIDEESAPKHNFLVPDLNILIVDDNKVNLLVAEGLLKPLEPHVDLAMSGKEAIAKVMEKKVRHNLYGPPDARKGRYRNNKYHA